ncbi:XH/XS domain-containing protein [Trifolium repens]|nr:XH/XS domain-containing protein [Trifolium repens]
MGEDKPVTRAELEGSFAALTATITALTTQVNNIINNNNNNNRNNKNRNNREGEPIPVIWVRNNKHIVVMYKKSEHTHESDLEYYERRYYNKLKDDYYNFKISDSIYRCPFCYNKDYSLTDLLRHASRIAGNSRKKIKDIAKHSVLITYMQSCLNVKDDETFSIINNDTTEINDASVVEKNQINEDLSSSEVVETDESLLLKFVNVAFNNKSEFCDVLPPPNAEEKLNLESEVQTEVKSKTVGTTIDEEGVINLELDGSFNVDNNYMDCDIQTKATPEIDEETKKKADANKPRRYKYIVVISNSMNISDSFNVADSHEYQAFNQDENSGSSSFEVEEKVKTSKALMSGASTRLSDSSTQTFVFDPGIRVPELRTEASLYYNRTRGRVLHKKRSLMQEQFNATTLDLILLYFT